MSDFKAIEQQIADLRKNHFNWQTIPNCVKAAHTMTKLLAVARAAEEHSESIEMGFASPTRPDIARAKLNKALTELKEGGE